MSTLSDFLNDVSSSSTDSSDTSDISNTSSLSDTSSSTYSANSSDPSITNNMTNSMMGGNSRNKNHIYDNRTNRYRRHNTKTILPDCIETETIESMLNKIEIDIDTLNNPLMNDIDYLVRMINKRDAN